ncbi:MAG: hypothetical protein IKP61_00560 [Spirochaetales bacterium]|nr:hypothetical protein [Spirochaetales bacterium]
MKARDAEKAISLLILGVVMEKKTFADFVPRLLAQLSENLGPAMVGINADEIETIMEERGK